MKSHRIFNCLLYLFFCIYHLSGQTTVPSNQPLQFQLIGIDTSISNIFYQDGGDKIELHLLPWTLSAPYDYNGSSPITLFRQVQTSEGIKKIPVTQIEIPPESTELLVFIQKSKERPRNYECLVLGNDLESHPMGQIRLLNLAPNTVIAGKVENEHAVVLPGDNYLFPIKSSAPLQTYHLLTQIDTEWERLNAGRVRMTEDTRLILACVWKKDPVDGDHYLIKRIWLR